MEWYKTYSDKDDVGFIIEDAMKLLGKHIQLIIKDE